MENGKSKPKHVESTVITLEGLLLVHTQRSKSTGVSSTVLSLQTLCNLNPYGWGKAREKYPMQFIFDLGYFEAGFCVVC